MMHYAEAVHHGYRILSTSMIGCFTLAVKLRRCLRRVRVLLRKIRRCAVFVLAVQFPFVISDYDPAFQKRADKGGF